MKKALLTLLAVIVIVGALAGIGYTGYRIGYNHGATSSGITPFFGRSDRMNPNFMPTHKFDRDFGFRNQPYHSSPMMGRGNSGFNMFSPFRFLWNAAILALVIGVVYWLVTKSGWRISRTVQEMPQKTEGN